MAKVVTISKSFYDLCKPVSELLTKTTRPCLIVKQLIYKNNTSDFAIPFRSNIAPTAPKSQYFALPPRPTTKPKYRHGLHYVKMFPIQNKYLTKCYLPESPTFERTIHIIDSHLPQIVKEAQLYLKEYQAYGAQPYAVDIDKVIELMSDSHLNS